jgi:sialidase-1
MASILGLDAGKALLFSGPTRKGRFDGVLFASADGGATWQRGAALRTGPFAYSCLTELADGQIGCLYETGEKGCYERIDFARFSTSWARTP